MSNCNITEVKRQSRVSPMRKTAGPLARIFKESRGIRDKCTQDVSDLPTPRPSARLADTDAQWLVTLYEDSLEFPRPPVSPSHLRSHSNWSAGLNLRSDRNSSGSDSDSEGSMSDVDSSLPTTPMPSPTAENYAAATHPTYATRGKTIRPLRVVKHPAALARSSSASHRLSFSSFSAALRKSDGDTDTDWRINLDSDTGETLDFPRPPPLLNLQLPASLRAQSQPESPLFSHSRAGGSISSASGSSRTGSGESSTGWSRASHDWSLPSTPVSSPAASVKPLHVLKTSRAGSPASTRSSSAASSPRTSVASSPSLASSASLSTSARVRVPPTGYRDRKTSSAESFHGHALVLPFPPLFSPSSPSSPSFLPRAPNRDSTPVAFPRVSPTSPSARTPPAPLRDPVYPSSEFHHGTPSLAPGSPDSSRARSFSAHERSSSSAAYVHATSPSTSKTASTGTRTSTRVRPQIAIPLPPNTSRPSSTHAHPPPSLTSAPADAWSSEYAPGPPYHSPSRTLSVLVLYAASALADFEDNVVGADDDDVPVPLSPLVASPPSPDSDSDPSAYSAPPDLEDNMAREEDDGDGDVPVPLSPLIASPPSPDSDSDSLLYLEPLPPSRYKDQKRRAPREREDQESEWVLPHADWDPRQPADPVHARHSSNADRNLKETPPKTLRSRWSNSTLSSVRSAPAQASSKTFAFARRLIAKPTILRKSKSTYDDDDGVSPSSEYATAEYGSGGTPPSGNSRRRKAKALDALGGGLPSTPTSFSSSSATHDVFRTADLFAMQADSSSVADSSAMQKLRTGSR
ncbi:hypothetical protein B0H11DRAFT_1950563 [Mycena galericulata]|nr:hypothetical protein B0H11DRAFT_1950563 [Mycena galericulata]